MDDLQSVMRYVDMRLQRLDAQEKEWLLEEVAENCRQRLNELKQPLNGGE